MDWLANGSPTWGAYCAFMSSRLIVLDKQPGVRSVGAGKMWRCVFSNIVLKVTGSEATMHVRMTTCVPNLIQELTVQSTGFKLFGKKTGLRKIRDSGS